MRNHHLQSQTIALNFSVAVSWCLAVLGAAGGGFSKLMRWLHEAQQCPCTQFTMPGVWCAAWHMLGGHMMWSQQRGREGLEITRLLTCAPPPASGKQGRMLKEWRLTPDLGLITEHMVLAMITKATRTPFRNLPVSPAFATSLRFSFCVHFG